MFCRPNCSTFLVTADPLRTEAKFDRALQNLVDKILPQFAVADEELRKEIAGIKPENNNQTANNSNNTGNNTKSELLRKRKMEDPAIPLEFVVFELIPAPKSDLSELDRSIIKSSPKVTVRALRKYLMEKLKLNLEENRNEIAILCSGELLGPDHSLAFVKRTRWHEETKHMVLTYKISQNTL